MHRMPFLFLHCTDTMFPRRLFLFASLPCSSHAEQSLLRSTLTTDASQFQHPANLGVSSFNNAFMAELREQTLRDLTGLKALRVACDHQLRKLHRALELLKVSSSTTSPAGGAVGAGVGAHSFPEVSVTDKLSQTALGLILTMVMPVPGSMEVGVASIGALWLQGDSAGKHLVVEHPLEADGGLRDRFDPFTRFRQRARRNGELLIESWQAASSARDTASASGSDSTLLAPWQELRPLTS